MQKKSAAGKTAWTDPDDAPALGDDFFREADRYQNNKLVSRGRPKAAERKVAISIRLDPDVVDTLRAGGPGWQSRVNDILKDWLRQKRS